MKKNVFEISIGTPTQSFSNRKGTESKNGSSFSTARKLTHEILRPRETSLSPSNNFIVHKPLPLDSLPSLDTPRKNPIFRGGAHIIDSLTKLNEFRSSSQNSQCIKAEQSPMGSQTLHYSKPGSGHRGQPSLELSKGREELGRIRADKQSLEKKFKDKIQRLEEENEFLRQKDKSGSKVSLRLLEIENQNSKIMENIQTAKASLVEKEKNYLEKIQALKRENLALEQDLCGLRKKAYEREISCSKLKHLEDHYDLTMLEMSRQKKKIDTLSHSEQFLKEHLNSLQEREGLDSQRIAQLTSELAAFREQNARLKGEVGEMRQCQSKEYALLAQRIEEVTQKLCTKNEEVKLLTAQMHCGDSQLGESMAGEAVDALNEENLLLSQMLNNLQKKYETVHRIAHGDRSRPNLSFAEKPRPRTEQKECRKEYYGDAPIDQRLILSSTERFDHVTPGLPYLPPLVLPQPRANPGAVEPRECSFKKYDANFFKDDSQGATSLGQTSGEEVPVSFTPNKRDCPWEGPALAQREGSESRGLTHRAGYSPVKRVIFNQLLSDDNEFCDKETVRHRHAQDYSLQDETTLFSMDASVARPSTNLFYAQNHPRC